MTQPVGILGGTFDPVHNGHLHLATTFIDQLKLAEIRFVPLNNPPHRSEPLASPDQRLKMLNLALKNHARLIVDDCELHREGISYTIDTVERMRNKYIDTPLCLIMGIDNFKTLNSWHRWRSLLEYTHIVIANRPGSEGEIYNDEIKNFMNSHIVQSVATLHERMTGCIMKLDIPMLDISSTQIRNKLRSRQQTNSLLPDKVLDFIQANNLYNK